MTANLNKVREAENILGEKFLVDHRKLDLVEIQSLKSAEIIKKKAEEAYKILKLPVLVDDTSLSFAAWNGLPGPLIKWFVERMGEPGLCRMLKGEKNRKATVTCSVAFYDGKKIKIVNVEEEGIITDKPMGKAGFGFDSIFIPKGQKKTYAQMTSEEKDKISHRKLALEKMRKYLNQSS